MLPILSNSTNVLLLEPNYPRKQPPLGLAKGKYIRNGVRIAFDRIEEDGVFQKSVEMLINSGVSKSDIMSYVLFNFDDRPKDAYYRAAECTRLGIRPYPQYYRPLNILNKNIKFVGKHWTLNLGRAFRTYWLMRGTWSKMSFGEYLASKECILKFKINSEDMTMWENNGKPEKIILKKKVRK